ncbi:MAG: hypothetical protein KGI69_03990 [Patescibacteria group bacterium]|nr:hypothetical protein [Patescibacteria group bacterium]
MHPLSLFPSLLTWQLAAPLMIRIVLGAVFIHWAYKELRNPVATIHAKGLCVIEGLAGILIFIGLYTQGAALVAAIDLVIRLIGRISKKAFLTDGVNYYLLLLVLAASLMVTGPGFLAFDLPL